MTIIRTPRKWPGYRTHRRHKLAGRRGDIITLPGVHDRDFSTHAFVARLAVTARNSASYRQATAARQRVMLGEEVVDVIEVDTERASAIVACDSGPRRVALSALTVGRRAGLSIDRGLENDNG